MATYYIPASQIAQLKASRQLSGKQLVPTPTTNSIWETKLKDPETLAWNSNAYTLREGDVVLMRNISTGVNIESVVELADGVRFKRVLRRRYGED